MIQINVTEHSDSLPSTPPLQPQVRCGQSHRVLKDRKPRPGLSDGAKVAAVMAQYFEASTVKRETFFGLRDASRSFSDVAFWHPLAGGHAGLSACHFGAVASEPA